MLLAVIEFSDLMIFGILILVLLGGTAVTSRRSAGNRAVDERLHRMEDKLNVLMTHMGIDYVPSAKERWQRLADGNDRLAAVKEYSDAHSAPLHEAQRVVEQYMADARRTS